MKKWRIYSIVITIILILLVIGICLYLFVFKENITEQEARNIAFEYANVSENNITLLSCNKDTEDRKYEIKFYDDKYEYEVDVNYNSGKIDTFEKDIRDDVIVNNNNNNTNSNNSSNNNTNDNNNIQNNVSNNNSNNTSNNMTNSVNNATSTTTNNSNYIGEERAKEIALNHAGMNNSNDVRFSKVELDVDHNISTYEIEFYYNNVEYDYEINAVTGEVIKYEKGR